MTTPNRNYDVLLIAPDGMLGRAWAALLEERGIPHHTVAYPQLDLTKPETVARAITGSPTHIINCSAYTDVDGAESHEDIATAINGDGVGLLAARAQQLNAQLVHYSTDYVFSGEGTEPYSTDGEREPLNAYGRSKAAGEVAIEQSGARHLIIRTSWLYAPWGSNFVLTMRRLSRERDRLSVVDDQRGRPTSALYLAERTLGLMDAGAEGIFHVTDGGECTWFDFTCEIMRQLSRDCPVDRSKSSALGRAARRPSYSVLDLSKTDALLGPSRPWQECLADVVARLRAEGDA